MFTLLHVFMCMSLFKSTEACKGTHVEVLGKHVGVCSLLAVCVSGIKLRLSDWKQECVPTEPSHQHECQMFSINDQVSVLQEPTSVHLKHLINSLLQWK